MSFPNDALCRDCGHDFEAHGPPCLGCIETGGDFDEAWHGFAPVAGPFHGSADAERAAYEAVMLARTKGTATEVADEGEARVSSSPKPVRSGSASSSSETEVQP